MTLHKSRTQWELMLPEEFRAAFDSLPVCFLPLGAVEWHGEHNALGLDALKAQALCARAAEKAGGGIVHPPLYGGMGGRSSRRPCESRMMSPGTTTCCGLGSRSSAARCTDWDLLCYYCERTRVVFG